MGTGNTECMSMKRWLLSLFMAAMLAVSFSIVPAAVQVSPAGKNVVEKAEAQTSSQGNTVYVNNTADLPAGNSTGYGTGKLSTSYNLSATGVGNYTVVNSTATPSYGNLTLPAANFTANWTANDTVEFLNKNGTFNITGTIVDNLTDTIANVTGISYNISNGFANLVPMPTGSNSSETDPFYTIQGAVNGTQAVLGGNQTIKVANSTYNENVDITGNNLTVRGWAGMPKPTITNASLADYAFNITGTNTTLQDLVITNSAKAVVIGSSGDDFTINSTTVNGSSIVGISTGTGNGTITESKIYDNTLGVNATGITENVDATHNWWDSHEGPTVNVSETGTLGDKITGNITYSPWYYENTLDTLTTVPVPYSKVTNPTTTVLKLDADTYGPESTATMSVLDSDYDTNSSAHEQIWLKAWTDTAGNSTSGFENVTLTETGVDTGNFTGTVTFNTTASSNKRDTLAVRGGDTITAQFTDEQNQSGEPENITDNATFEFTRTGNVTLDKSDYYPTSTAKVTLEDKDLNTDSNVKETHNVTVASETNNLTLPLTETLSNSGKFEGTFDFNTSGTSSGTTLGVTRNDTHTASENVKVTYYDNETASDGGQNITDNATFHATWTGTIISLDKPAYAHNATVNMTLYDPDLNANTTAIDTVNNSTTNYFLMAINTTAVDNLTSLSGYDTVNITSITENGSDTGYFYNGTAVTINTTGDAGASELHVAPGEKFTILYYDSQDDTGGNTTSSFDAGNYSDYTAKIQASTYQTASVAVMWNTAGNITGNLTDVTGGNVWGKDTQVLLNLTDADGGGMDLDTSAPDDITVAVNSTVDSTGIDLTLTETGDNTGVFNGTLGFTDGASDAASRIIQVNSSDFRQVSTNVFVTFNDTVNATANQTLVTENITHWWSDNGTATLGDGTTNATSEANPVTFYPDSTGYVWVNDGDRNADASAIDSFNVSIIANNGTSTKSISRNLTETGNDTGLFSGNFTFGANGLSLTNSSWDGSNITVSYNDTHTALGNKTTNFNFTYGQFDWTTNATVAFSTGSAAVGQNVTLSIDDYDSNTNSTANDTIQADIWSNTTKANPMTITLNETGADTHVFNATIRFSPTARNESLNQIKVSDGDTITANFTDQLDTAGNKTSFTNSSLTVNVYYTGQVNFDKSQYNLAESPVITLTDKDLDTDSTIINYPTVNVTSNESCPSGITVKLAETGVDTGKFTRSINLTTGTASTRTLNVTLGETICVSYNDTHNAEGNNVAVNDTAEIVKSTNDTLRLDSDYYSATDTATIRIHDSDLNTNSNLADSYNRTASNVTANSTSDSTGINISIQERGDNSGVFTANITFGDSSNAANKTLEVTDGDTVQVTYRDASNETGQTENLTDTALYDESVPQISNFTCSESPVKEGTTVQLTVDVSDNVSGLAENATMTVNGNNATFVSAINGTSTYNYTVTKSDTEGWANVTVSAKDKAGNTNTASNATLFKIDTSPPTFSGWTPADGEVVTQAPVNISVSYNDTYSSINTSSVVMKLNGVTVNATATDTGANYTASADELAIGANDVVVNASDELGHENSTSWSFIYDTAPPRITSTIPDKTNKQQPTIGATITDNETNVNASSIELQVDGSTISKWTFNASTGKLRYTPTKFKYSEATHTVDLSVKDKAGLSSSESWNFTVDLTEPSVSVSVNPAKVKVGKNVTVTVNASDDVTTAENLAVTATVDSESINLTRSGSTWTGVFSKDTAGDYTVTANATDEAGNSATDTASVTVSPAIVVENITATPASVNMTVNETQQLTVNATYSDGSWANVTDAANYTSSNTTVATVDSTGLITAQAAGTANITVSYTEENITKKDTVAVNVSTVAWYSDWTEDGKIDDDEIMEAVKDWLTGTPHNGHTLTDDDILWLVQCWLKGEVASYPGK